jgi:DNA-binding CsgD family transcriptional regulator
MVKMHRHSAMLKLGVVSIVELIQLADKLGF